MMKSERYNRISIKKDYRKILKTLRHPENTPIQFESIEKIINLFIERWKKYHWHPIFKKAKEHIELELKLLKTR